MFKGVRTDKKVQLSLDIAGAGGGTGATPLGSNSLYAQPALLTLPSITKELTEMGMADEVRIRISGGVENGKQVAWNKLLGADTRIMTSPMLFLGCVMLRDCEKNTCGTGVATTKAELREFFSGTPDKFVQNLIDVYIKPAAKEFLRMGIDPLKLDTLTKKDLKNIFAKMPDSTFKTQIFQSLNAENPYEGQVLAEPYPADGRTEEIIKQLPHKKDFAHIQVKESPQNAAFGTRLSGLAQRKEVRVPNTLLLSVQNSDNPDRLGHLGPAAHAFSKEGIWMLGENATDFANLCGLGGLIVGGAGFNAGKALTWEGLLSAGVLGNRALENCQVE